jgi:acyl dehydratase
MPLPDRAPDGGFDIAVRPEQALIYRLSGDENPLHAVPEVAARAGFSKPILHGLCSFAIAARALVAAEAGGDERRLKAVSVRFSSPAYPGETIRTEVWRLGGGEYALRARSVERDVVLLTGGRARLG